MPGINIVGSGHFVPGKPVTNKALARVMDTTDDWIKKRTGIEQRYFAGDGVTCTDLAEQAAKRALISSGLSATDVDYIIFATMTPDHIFPGSGGLLGHRLGIAGVPALDIRQQCCAFPFAFQVADGLVASGAAETILLVGSDVHAPFMPWQDWSVLEDPAPDRAQAPDYQRSTRHRGLAILFGDGAGALVLRRAALPGRGLLGVEVHTDGSLYQQLYTKAGFNRRAYWQPGSFTEEDFIPTMAGPELFKTAVTKLPEVVRSLCERQKVDLNAIDWFIAHQANDRINRSVADSLGIAPEKMPSNIARFGNTSAATIPILLDELKTQGTLLEGQLICMLAVGAGLNWGAALIRL